MIFFYLVKYPKNAKCEVKQSEKKKFKSRQI
jgi:hypothetical protein